MKRLFIIFCGLFSVNVNACDVCGAVNSSLGLGTIAAGNRHTIGCTYQYRTYKSNHPDFLGTPGIQSTERYQRIDLAGTVRLANRWQLKTSLPFVYNQQTKAGVTTAKQGLGDPIISVQYFIANRQDSLATKNIRWSLGGGVKLPAGQFAEPHNEVLLLYPGTGTVDAVLQSSLFMRKNKWGLIQETNCVIRSTNKYGYTPGSLFNATLYGFRKFDNWSVFGGFQYAWNGIDYQNRTAISSSPSEGSMLSATLGGTIQWGNLLLQANYHLPVVQQLGSGSVNQQTSFTASIYYLFN